jgi:hypothetical protein
MSEVPRGQKTGNSGKKVSDGGLRSTLWPTLGSILRPTLVSSYFSPNRLLLPVGVKFSKQKM